MGGTLAAEPAHRIAVGAETLALRMAIVRTRWRWRVSWNRTAA